MRFRLWCWWNGICYKHLVEKIPRNHCNNWRSGCAFLHCEECCDEMHARADRRRAEEAAALKARLEAEQATRIA